ncbi:MAG: hypothetical protein M1837_007137 [Sclerophora amabilis]|nr:MAG: hypothetical protein M1837_007137 [Sclerophora amabilis]
MDPGQTESPGERKRQLYKAGEPTKNRPHSHRTQPKLGTSSPLRTSTLFWDSLSRIWLTPRACREFDRRTSPTVTPLPPNLSGLRRARPAKLKRFARHGGPSLGDLRAYPEPQIAAQPSLQPNQNRSNLSSHENSSSSTMAPKMSAYDRNFEDHLEQFGIYTRLSAHRHHFVFPNNLDDLTAALARPRPSLSASDLSAETYFQYVELERRALTEATAMTTAFSIILGDIEADCAHNILFGNLEPLTDGSLANPKPDRYDGCSPATLALPIREELGTFIIPSTNSTAPCVPNFFLEGKGPSSVTAIGMRQACYDGALGARAIHKLRMYANPQAGYDNNAYTISCTYNAGMGSLKIYAVHTAPSSNPTVPCEYHFNQIAGFDMTGSLAQFRAGATALRNARDWAKERREEFIQAANNRALNSTVTAVESSGHAVPAVSTDNVAHDQPGAGTNAEPDVSSG